MPKFSSWQRGLYCGRAGGGELGVCCCWVVCPEDEVKEEEEEDGFPDLLEEEPDLLCLSLPSFAGVLEVDDLDLLGFPPL